MKHDSFLMYLNNLAKIAGMILNVRLIVDRGYLKLDLDMSTLGNLALEICRPAHLNLPRMKGEKKEDKKPKRARFTSEEVVASREIARKRSHNEIGNLYIKHSRLLQHCIPHQYVSKLDWFMSIAAAVANKKMNVPST